MCFYFSHLTCTFHFNCCLNKIFVIVIFVIVISLQPFVNNSSFRVSIKAVTVTIKNARRSAIYSGLTKLANEIVQLHGL